MLLNIQSFSQMSDLNIKYSIKDNSFNFKPININLKNTNNKFGLLEINKSYYNFKTVLSNNNKINYKFKKGKNDRGQMFMIFVHLVGLYSGYLAYDSFRSGDKVGGYLFSGLSAVLIVVPVVLLKFP